MTVTNEYLRKILALLAFLFGMILSLIALFLPPVGVIDPSVLILIAQLLVFVATCMAINLPIIINKK